MYQFNITIYFILLGISFYYQNAIAIYSILVIGILILVSYPIYRKNKKENIKQEVKNKTAKINVNRAPWWIIEELPGFKSVDAKKVVWIRKHNGKYKSKEDFFLKNNIKNQDKLEDFICL